VGLLHDLVVHGVGLDAPGRIALGDAIPAPRFSGTVGPRVAELLLPGLPSSPSLPINWRQVKDITENVCSQVTVVERLL
jgi:hypothetical protein